MRFAAVRHMLVALAVSSVALVACGGSDAEPVPEVASCSIARSELGPFNPSTPLGASMTEAEARARMADDGIVEWLAISATGPWDKAWDRATVTLGQGIHTELTWLDVNGEIRGLYQSDDAFGFEDLRVSRSFQGKIEHSDDDPLYLPLQDLGTPVNFEADCTITAVEFGDQTNELLLDATDAIT